MVYNQKDNVWYGTSTQRLATSVSFFPDTSKAWDVDTKALYILYSGTWYPM